MGQDLRKLVKEEQTEQHIKMSDGHEKRFLEKLDKELPIRSKGNHFSFLSIAASVIVLLGLTYGAFQMFQPSNTTDPQESESLGLKSLGDVSPDLKRVEDYYLASINLELSKVQLTPDNKELFDGYIERLKELNDEYKNLTLELNENGPNEITLNALIDNLKFRLNLVTRLKDKLSEYNDEAFKQESI